MNSKGLGEARDPWLGATWMELKARFEAWWTTYDRFEANESNNMSYVGARSFELDFAVEHECENRELEREEGGNYMMSERFTEMHEVTVGILDHGSRKVEYNMSFTNALAMCFANADYDVTDMCSACEVELYAGFMMNEVEDVCLLGHAVELMTFVRNFTTWLSEIGRGLTNLDIYMLVHAALSELWYRTGWVLVVVVCKSLHWKLDEPLELCSRRRRSHTC